MNSTDIKQEQPSRLSQMFKSYTIGKQNEPVNNGFQININQYVANYGNNGADPAMDPDHNPDF